MDTEKLSKDYMDQYNALTTEYRSLGINDLVNDLNTAVSKSDMDKMNGLYDDVLNWNNKVANLAGVRNSLNSQFSYLHLPSPILFLIEFDGEEKMWKFNTRI